MRRMVGNAGILALGIVLATFPAVMAWSGEIATPAAVTRGSGAINAMHPAVTVLDAEGRAAAKSGGVASVERTCGTCHDAEYINSHSGHWNDRVKATCVECHLEPGAWPPAAASLDADGRIRHEALRISSPRNENCASCHQLVHSGPDPLQVPGDFETAASGRHDPAFTRNTGGVFSSQSVSESYLNLRDKARQSYPWDVHAQRLVRCVDCHYSPNDPRRGDERRASLDFVVRDPRRISISDYLHRPDHRMATATCRSCHDATKVHEFLPYKERHLDVLDCRACHIPRPLGPAAQMIDSTVVREDGTPVIVYRGMDRGDGASLNTTYLSGYDPLLLIHDAPRDSRLAPFNAVDEWSWVSGSDEQAVPLETLQRAFLDQGKYAPAILAVFDADHDGVVRAAELRLDSPARRDLIRARLVALGVRDPIVRHRLTLHPLAHGVMSGEQVQRDCASCHARESRLLGTLPLSVYLPADSTTERSATILGPVRRDAIRLRLTGDGSAIEARIPDRAPLYVFGHSRRAWASRLGLGLLIAVVLSVLVHMGLRVTSRRTPPASSVPPRRVYLYSVYERGWHWLMALSIIALILTGLQIEFVGVRSPLPFPLAVAVHNFFALVLTVNAFLSLFYHLATSAIRQFIPPKEGLARQVVAQAEYYARGILLGQPHPSPRSAARKLNPLQQLTYLALLNVLFPLQVITGILIWGISRWPRFADAIGGLSVIAPVHDLGAWLFLTFFVLHLYLITTGHTVFSHVGSMLDGYGEVEQESPMETGGPHA
jgi:thiosulfate reductase cytochrome b subunit